MTKVNKQFLLWLRTAAACLVLETVVAGCSNVGGTNAPRPSAMQPGPAQIEPSPSQFGPSPAKVVSANPELRFVVVDFSSRVMPPIGTRLNVYRGDKSIGAIQITEPVRARLATADVVEGDVRVGDEAR